MASPSSTVRRTHRLVTDGPDETRALARVLAGELNVGDLLVLTGDLGAGKTCFTQGLAAALGIDEPVTSPTFTLASRYRGVLTLHHLDVYRLDSEADGHDLAVEELVEDGVVVVEWGERIVGILPEDHLVITLAYADDPERLDRRVIDIDVPDSKRHLWSAVAAWLEQREPADD
jgi:tRNA threonylcarbamoyladenosine biosynthesis protein TsaE